MSELTQKTTIDRTTSGLITLEWLKAYAEVSDDPNLIHLDVEVARSVGLPNAIAHGMLIAGLLHSRVEQVILGSDVLQGSRIQNSRTRFKGMTFLGDEVFTEGTWQLDGSETARIELQATNQRGEVLVTAQVDLLRKAEK